MPHEKYSLVRFMFLQEENEKQDDQIAKTKNSDIFFSEKMVDFISIKKTT